MLVVRIKSREQAHNTALQALSLLIVTAEVREVLNYSETPMPSERQQKSTLCPSLVFDRRTVQREVECEDSGCLGLWGRELAHDPFAFCPLFKFLVVSVALAEFGQIT